ncbi:BREX system ATP-binding domain-containing protein [Paenibacillus sp. 2TAB26]|uniref:BREX system ATP-binding domain-containing protein n=1 Tax=Paenibacillus sp. 2TAB26 TaxID=3233005 RepID=UPI003F967F81
MLLTEAVNVKEMMNGGPMNVASFLHIAIGLTESVYRAHKQNELCGNLNPASIQIQLDMKAAISIDPLLRDYTYMSPEQTGRINHMPDGRSDLYALGMIFYEMLSGRLPFHAQSVEEWIHAHLAVVPKPLSEWRSDMAGSLEAVIMKLLSKNPEERYQSAYGLLSDLKRCALSMEEKGEVISFEIAQADEASRFRLPQTLFGREMEERALRDAFEQAKAGASSFVFVSGSAGSGKTVLVRALQMLVRRDGGRFVSGKCDMMNRDIPFSSLLEALRSLIRQIWSESPDRVAKLKKQLTKALGQGAAVIVQLLPEAAELFDVIPAIEPLHPAEAAIRFNRLVPIFIKVFVDKQHPLVIFLDDLQWADPATIDVLRTIVHDQARPGLLVISAFREEFTLGWQKHEENKVDAAAWMAESLSLHDELQLSVHHIHLEALSYIEVRQFVSDVLDENSARIRSLAEVLYHRTGGNPLYLNRLLDNLYRENKLYYDEVEASWVWEPSVIAEIPEDPDIVHLIEARIRMLSPEKIELLAIGAAIGHRFCSLTISLVSGNSLLHVRRLLHVIEEEGLICRENDSDESDGVERYYRFLHDRIQQAAYMTMSESDQTSLHLTIGRVIRDHLLSESVFTIFDMVHHLNLGSEKIVDDAEKRELAAFNYQAGIKSKATTAFTAALHFYEIALRLSGGDWQNTASLDYRLMLEVSECEYMCGHTDRAEELLANLMSCTTNVVERSHIYLIRIAMYSYLKKDEAAVHIGQHALAELGWHLPSKPSKALVIKEILMTQSALFNKGSEVPHLPINRDPRYKALSDLVMAISLPVYVLSLEQSAVLFSRFVRYGLKYGSNEAFSFMLASYGMVIYKMSGFRTGPQYVDQAFHLPASFDSADLRSRLYYLKGLVGIINPDEGIKQFEKSIQYGMESANLTYVSIAMMTAITNYTGDLYSLSARIKDYEETSQQLVDGVTRNIFRRAKWYIAQMQDGAGESDEVATSLLNEPYKDFLNNEVYYTCTCNIEIAYLFGRYWEAIEWAKRGERNTFLQTRPHVRKQRMYHSLTLAAMYSEALPNEQKRIRMKLREHLRSMRRWSGYSGKDSSTYLLISAEFYRMEGNRVAAAERYEEAIRAAREAGEGLMGAISCERASIFYRQMVSVNGAEALIADACEAYTRWGATAKARQLRETNEGLRTAAIERIGDDKAVTEEPGAIEIKSEFTSWLTADNRQYKQQQEWMSSLDHCHTMDQFLELAIRYSGAEKGFIVGSEGEWCSVEKEGSLSDNSGASYGESIVRYVLKTGEPVVLVNALHSTYSADPSIRRNQSQSVLCMPVLFTGGLRPFALYLENSLIAGVFTQEIRVMLEQMIARMMYVKSLDEARSQSYSLIVPTDDLSSTSAKASQLLFESLTNRETEILYALTDGLTNKEIAYRFGLTEGTVKGYIHNVYGKLGVKRRSQAIARAKELELLN